jgi:hypothetical protein
MAVITSNSSRSKLRDLGLVHHECSSAIESTPHPLQNTTVAGAARSDPGVRERGCAPAWSPVTSCVSRT